MSRGAARRRPGFSWTSFGCSVKSRTRRICFARQRAALLHAPKALSFISRRWRTIRRQASSSRSSIIFATCETASSRTIRAYDMVQADPALQAILYPQQHIRTITHRTTGASLKVVAADDETVSEEGGRG